MGDLPIKLLDRKEVRRNSVFTVYADHIRDQSGNEVRDYLTVVPHHRTESGITGIAVLPVLEGRFGLIRIFRHAIRDYCWEVVRGFIDAGETPAAAALRELREEAGLDAAAGALTDLGVVAPEPGLLDARVSLFVAENCAAGRAKPGNEIGHGELRYHTREALGGMIGRGEIVDPCTLLCCWRYLSPLPGTPPRAPA